MADIKELQKKYNNKVESLKISEIGNAINLKGITNISGLISKCANSENKKNSFSLYAYGPNSKQGLNIKELSPGARRPKYTIDTSRFFIDINGLLNKGNTYDMIIVDPSFSLFGNLFNNNSYQAPSFIINGSTTNCELCESGIHFLNVTSDFFNSNSGNGQLARGKVDLTPEQQQSYSQVATTFKFNKGGTLISNKPIGTIDVNSINVKIINQLYINKINNNTLICQPDIFNYGTINEIYANEAIVTNANKINSIITPNEKADYITIVGNSKDSSIISSIIHSCGEFNISNSTVNSCIIAGTNYKVGSNMGFIAANTNFNNLVISGTAHVCIHNSNLSTFMYILQNSEQKQQNSFSLNGLNITEMNFSTNITDVSGAITETFWNSFSDNDIEFNFDSFKYTNIDFDNWKLKFENTAGIQKCKISNFNTNSPIFAYDKFYFGTIKSTTINNLSGYISATLDSSHILSCNVLTGDLTLCNNSGLTGYIINGKITIGDGSSNIILDYSNAPQILSSQTLLLNNEKSNNFNFISKGKLPNNICVYIKNKATLKSLNLESSSTAGQNPYFICNYKDAKIENISSLIGVNAIYNAGDLIFSKPEKSNTISGKVLGAIGAGSISNLQNTNKNIIFLENTKISKNDSIFIKLIQNYKNTLEQIANGTEIYEFPELNTLFKTPFENSGFKEWFNKDISIQNKYAKLNTEVTLEQLQLPLHENTQESSSKETKESYLQNDIKSGLAELIGGACALGVWLFAPVVKVFSDDIAKSSVMNINNLLNQLEDINGKPAVWYDPRTWDFSWFPGVTNPCPELLNSTLSACSIINFGGSLTDITINNPTRFLNNCNEIDEVKLNNVTINYTSNTNDNNENLSIFDGVKTIEKQKINVCSGLTGQIYGINSTFKNSTFNTNIDPKIGTGTLFYNMHHCTFKDSVINVIGGDKAKVAEFPYSEEHIDQIIDGISTYFGNIYMFVKEQTDVDISTISGGTQALFMHCNFENCALNGVLSSNPITILVNPQILGDLNISGNIVGILGAENTIENISGDLSSTIQLAAVTGHTLNINKLNTCNCKDIYINDNVYIKTLQLKETKSTSEHGLSIYGFNCLNGSNKFDDIQINNIQLSGVYINISSDDYQNPLHFPECNTLKIHNIILNNFNDYTNYYTKSNFDILNYLNCTSSLTLENIVIGGETLENIVIGGNISKNEQNKIYIKARKMGKNGEKQFILANNIKLKNIHTINTISLIDLRDDCEIAKMQLSEILGTDSITINIKDIVKTFTLNNISEFNDIRINLMAKENKSLFSIDDYSDKSPSIINIQNLSISSLNLQLGNTHSKFLQQQKSYYTQLNTDYLCDIELNFSNNDIKNYTNITFDCINLLNTVNLPVQRFIARHSIISGIILEKPKDKPNSKLIRLQNSIFSLPSQLNVLSCYISHMDGKIYTDALNIKLNDIITNLDIHNCKNNYTVNIIDSTTTKNRKIDLSYNEYCIFNISGYNDNFTKISDTSLGGAYNTYNFDTIPNTLSGLRGISIYKADLISINADINTDIYTKFIDNTNILSGSKDLSISNELIDNLSLQNFFDNIRKIRVQNCTFTNTYDEISTPINTPIYIFKQFLSGISNEITINFSSNTNEANKKSLIIRGDQEDLYKKIKIGENNQLSSIIYTFGNDNIWYLYKNNTWEKIEINQEQEEQTNQSGDSTYSAGAQL